MQQKDGKSTDIALIIIIMHDVIRTTCVPQMCKKLTVIGCSFVANALLRHPFCRGFIMRVSIAPPFTDICPCQQECFLIYLICASSNGRVDEGFWGTLQGSISFQDLWIGGRQSTSPAQEERPSGNHLPVYIESLRFLEKGLHVLFASRLSDKNDLYLNVRRITRETITRNNEGDE